MIAEPTAWYLLLYIWGKYPVNFHLAFETEADCEYVGKAIKQRAKEKQFGTIDYLCWHPGKPPVRPMGGAQ